MIRTCRCGRRNRIPASRLTDAARCGACKRALGPVDTPLEVNVEDFREIEREARVPVLVDFWAAWCGPCRMAAPEVALAAKEAAGRALVVKVDTERYPELAQAYRVQGIPNFVVLLNGEVVRQHAGLVRHDDMLRWLREASPN